MGFARNGILHQYTSSLSAFEDVSLNSTSAENLIIFIGGLFDGLGTVPYTTSISNTLDRSWSLAQVIISSSYKGWGTSNLQTDVAEISKCVEYFRSIKKGMIVLMGHSTGCQDIMEYLTGSGHLNRAPVDGAIIQAPVSDREYIVSKLTPEVYARSCHDAQVMIQTCRGDKIIPYEEEIKDLFDCPITAKRWLSLASPNKDGDDDYFSSDLTAVQLINSFGNLPIRTPICILVSGADEYVPKSVDKIVLLNHWSHIIQNGLGKYDTEHSGIIEGASHNLSGNRPEIITDLVKRVLGFLAFLEKGN